MVSEITAGLRGVFPALMENIPAPRFRDVSGVKINRIRKAKGFSDKLSTAVVREE